MHSPTYPLKLGLYKGVHVIYSSFMQTAAKSAHLLKNSLVNSQSHINQRIYNMATVLRVKRRREDDSFEAFVVSAKRARTESSVHAAACATDVEAMDTVFDFAGTVEKERYSCWTTREQSYSQNQVPNMNLFTQAHTVHIP